MCVGSRTTKITLDSLLRGNHSTKRAKAGPGFDDRPDSIQIYSSSPWLGVLTKVLQILAATGYYTGLTQIIWSVLR